MFPRCECKGAGLAPPTLRMMTMRSDGGDVVSVQFAILRKQYATFVRMAEKLYEYQGVAGWWHGFRDNVREKCRECRERHGTNNGFWSRWLGGAKSSAAGDLGTISQDYSHIYRRKSRKELVRVSAAVMGIEFSYAAETAFVSPTLLKIGVEHKHMTLVWALSPLIGFFLTPILGSLSDRCPSIHGRRRPFIFVMSLGVLLGLILVPNGETLGYAMGDERPPNISNFTVLPHRISSNSLDADIPYNYTNSHPWGVFFTILGTVLLDFDADACQSPARAYLLDVTVPEDHARGLSTFTIMAGLGGFLGYALGGINWDVTTIGLLLGGHVRAVFSLITLIFIVCVTYTITSFREIPLELLESKGDDSMRENEVISMRVRQKYGSVDSTVEDDNDLEERTLSEIQNARRKSIVPDPNASLFLYLKSIVYMPPSIRILCVTNLFCWMAHVCYSLYFTDFVGEAVFEGNPTAIEGDPMHELYESGVRFGCWGMSMYSLSCACYSSIIERLIVRFGAKNVYVGGLLVYSSGMLLMAITKHRFGVIVFSWSAGVMYSTLFTMPYLLIAHYHSKGTFELDENGEEKLSDQIRGLGTDVALVSSMVFLAQFILSMLMGSIVNVSGTTTAVVATASALAFCGAIAATQIMYLDL